MKATLQVLARDLCYKKSAIGTRKDIQPVTGHLNFDSSIAVHKVFRKQQDSSKSMRFWESIVVGCLSTKDRRAAVETTQQNICRFCGVDKETVLRLTNCSIVKQKIPQPSFPNGVGNNFRTFGLVEIQHQDMYSRLRMSELATVPVADWSSHSACDFTFFTDGCVIHPQHYWATAGSFAVVDCHGNTICSGRVYHWALSSYTTELWALIFAFATSPGSCVVISDCKSVVSQCKFIIEFGYVPVFWSHISWWNFLLDLINLRKAFHPSPLTIQWVHSHLIDHTWDPDEIESIATSHGTLAEYLVNNKKADAAAKAVFGPDSGALENQLRQISDWQAWLTKLAMLVSDTTPDLEPIREQPLERIPFALNKDSPIREFQRAFPLWNTGRVTVQVAIPVHGKTI